MGSSIIPHIQGSLFGLQREEETSSVKQHRGATADETAIALALRMSAASARFKGLKDAGIIEETAERRLTSGNRMAKVCRLVHAQYADGGGTA